jgi:hypothetical protein
MQLAENEQGIRMKEFQFSLGIRENLKFEKCITNIFDKPLVCMLPK